MQLNTFKELRLEGEGFQETLSLLVLSFLSLEGTKQRGELADLFWINKLERRKRLRSLAQVIYRLQKESRQLIRLQGEWLSTEIKTDVHGFREALARGDNERALALFEGHFLEGIERNKRLKFLGEEITEWIVNTREKLYTEQLLARLELAEKKAFDETFEDAAEIAWQGYRLGQSVSYPTPEVYERLHLLLLAAEKVGDARQLCVEAEEIYGTDECAFCEHPFEARARLTHTYSFRPKNPNLVNREGEIETLLTWLTDPDKRLICIVGPPGIGKTELASVLVRGARGRAFARQGVHIAWLETLSAAADTGNVLTALANAVELTLRKNEVSADDLVAHIGDSHKLLVLDNYEQLVARHAGLVAELHARCPNLRLLITSREGLKLEHEQPLFLKHLAYPRKGDLSLAEARGYAAVELFELTATKRGFALNETNLASVIAICEQVEGLPLALKLAAGWADALSADQIAARLGEKLELLSQGVQDTYRHKSLAAAIDYSLDLLTDEERESLVKLAVFAGGFTLEAAQQVTATGVHILRPLIEKSLLRFDLEARRYSLHPLIHQHLRALLGDRQEASGRTRAAHCDFYLTFLTELIDVAGAVKQERIGELKAETANVAAAWRWATDEGMHDALFHASKALQTFGSLAAQYRFAETLLAYALEHCPPEQQALNVALSCNLGSIHFRLGDYGRAVALTQQALENLPKAGIEPERELSILQLIYTTQMLSYSSLAKFDKALVVAHETLKLFKEKAPQSLAHADILVNLAVLEKDILGESDLARYDEALSIYEQNGQNAAIPWVLVNKAEQLILLRDFEKAEKLLSRAEQIAKKLELGHWLAVSRYHRAVIQEYLEQFDKAIQLCHEVIPLAQAQEKYSLLGRISRLLAQIAEETQRPSWDYYSEALAYAVKTDEIALVNGIRVDQLGYLLKVQDYESAGSLYSTLQREKTRMYYVDKRKLRQIVTSEFLGIKQ